MNNNSKLQHRLYGDGLDLPAFESRKYRTALLLHERRLMLCEYCMTHRCYDTSSKRHSRSKSRTWKRHRRHQRKVKSEG